MSKIILESPFANEDQKKFNSNYLYLCVVARKLMIENEQAPLFFHALYTQFLNDNIKFERDLGLNKSFDWHTHGDYKLYAIDRSISKGMILGGEDAVLKGVPVYFFTAMPENSEEFNEVKIINENKDNKTRWIKGNKLVEKWNTDLEKKERFEKTGALSVYEAENEKDLNNVKNCLLNFFEPLIESIKNER